jgi:hypothetical protein
MSSAALVQLYVPIECTGLIPAILDTFTIDPHLSFSIIHFTTACILLLNKTNNYYDNSKRS